MIDQLNQPIPPPLDMRKTAQFVINSVSSYAELAHPQGKFDEKFLDVLAAILPSANIEPINHPTGGFLRVFQPVENGSQKKDVAVKILFSDQFQGLEYPPTGVTEEEIRQLLHERDFVKFANRKQEPQFDDLTSDEKVFLGLAAVHKKYAQLFPSFVLPSSFIAYKTDHDITAKVEDFEKERLSARGRLSDDGQEIIHKAGDVVYGMVQDVQVFPSGKSVTFMESEELTVQDKEQITAFIRNVEEVYEKYGLYPDDGKSRFHDLYLNSDGALVFIDTNHLKKRSQVEIVDTSYRSAVRKLRNLISGNKEI